jgi:hypothetical protein
VHAKQYPAQGCRVINGEVAATDRGLAVLINEMKGPAFVELEVEQQPAHRERVQRMPVDALALNPRAEFHVVNARGPRRRSWRGGPGKKRLPTLRKWYR